MSQIIVVHHKKLQLSHREVHISFCFAEKSVYAAKYNSTKTHNKYIKSLLVYLCRSHR